MRTAEIATATLIDSLATLHIDGHYLESLAEGDPDFTLDLLQLFFEDNTPYIDRARVALARRDFSGIATCAHKLKGSSAILRARRVQHLAEALEQHLIAEHPEAITCVLDDLTDFMQTLRQFLNGYGLPQYPGRTYDNAGTTYASQSIAPDTSDHREGVLKID